MKSGSISCFFCKTASLQQQQRSMTLVMHCCSCFDALSTTFHMPTATALSELTRATGAEPQEDFLPVPSSQSSAVSGFSVPSLNNTSPASLMQSCCMLCKFLCHPTMVWFARSSVFSPLTCTGLRSRFLGNPLTWDCKAIQANQRLHRFPWISKNMLLEWKASG